MKAFVIKNENNNGWGKYFEIAGQDGCYTDNIAKAEIYSDYKSAKKHCLFNDDKPVEITIEETKHQTQKAIECLKEVKEDIRLLTDLSMIKETEHKTAILNFYKDIMQVINAIIDNKIKELEEQNGQNYK